MGPKLRHPVVRQCAGLASDAADLSSAHVLLISPSVPSPTRVISVTHSDSIVATDSIDADQAGELLTPLPSSRSSWRHSKSMRFIVLFLRTNWHRLICTSIGWFVWDVAFYGTFLFQKG